MGRIGAAASPRFSPDGREIAFITTLSGLPQLWRMPAQGGYPRAVTAGDDPVSGAAWAPDGGLAFAVAPGGGYNAQIYIATPDGLQRRRITAGGEENNFTGDFAADGRYWFRSNLRDAASTDAWIFDPETGEASLALEIEGLGGISDLIGNKALVFRLVTRGNGNLWLDDLETGASTLLTPHEGPASVTGEFSADGRAVFVAHNLDRATRCSPASISMTKASHRSPTPSLNATASSSTASSWTIRGARPCCSGTSPAAPSSSGSIWPAEPAARCRHPLGNSRSTQTSRLTGAAWP
jgi:Tol biopolymer transport system component